MVFLQLAACLSSLSVIAGQDIFLASERPRHLEYHHRNPGFFDSSALLSDSTATNPRDRHFHASRLQRAASQAVFSATPPMTSIKPTDFGADPTGTKSSSDAFDQAMQAMLALASDSRMDFLGHYDLGGATLDLNGGVYLIDRPISFPALYANFRVQSGTLMASQSFPKDSYMLVVGGQGCDETKDGGCNRNIDFTHMTLDGQSVAFGGIIANHTMDINIGPAMYITSWTGVGVSLEGSGAGQIHQAWLGEIPFGSPVSRYSAKGTAILLASGQHDGQVSDVIIFSGKKGVVSENEGNRLQGQHDAQVSDVIIFSGKKGVVSENEGNRLQGVHAWNLAGAAGGIGIEVGSKWGPSGGRIENSYLDYAPLVIKNPGNCIVTNTLFLGSSTIVLKATRPNVEVRGLIITSNIHHTGNTGNQSITLDEREGHFGSIVDTVIENNQVGKVDMAAGKKSARATKSQVMLAGAKEAEIYYSEHLVFNTAIDPASVQCWLSGTHATAITTSLMYDKCVKVMLAEAVPTGTNITVTCSVDQSSRDCPAH